MAQVPNQTAGLLVRSSRPAEGLTTDLAAAVRAGDSSIPIYDVKTMEQRVNESLVGRKFVVLLIGAFAAWRYCWLLWACMASSVTPSACALANWGCEWRGSAAMSCSWF